MDFLTAFLNFIINPQIKIGPKATTLLAILLLLLLTDNIFGFSHYYNLNSKLEVVEKVAAIRKDTALSVKEKQELQSIQISALNRKNLKDRVYDLIFTSKKKTSLNTAPDKKISSDSRNMIIHYITSAFVMIFFFFFHSINNFFEKEKSFGYWVGEVVALFLVFNAIGLVLALFFGLIPPINGNYIYNYVVQAVINILLVIYELVKRHEKLKRWAESVEYNRNLMAERKYQEEA